jgi:hypothetical protein
MYAAARGCESGSGSGCVLLHQLDYPGAQETEYHSRDVEVASRQIGRDGAQVALAVYLGEYLPLVRQEVEECRVRVVHRRERGDHSEMRHLPFDPRPLVYAPRTLHEERLGGYPDARFRRRIERALLLEAEEALAPG